MAVGSVLAAVLLVSLAVAGCSGNPEPLAPSSTSSHALEPTKAAKRNWTAPVQPTTAGSGEPIVAVDAMGIIYYAPAAPGGPWRSTDGGRTFKEIPIPLPPGSSASGSDTSLALAPDGSVWFARVLDGLFGAVAACVSSDRGDDWTCDWQAIPGSQDRMWIAGADKMHGYVMAISQERHDAAGGLLPNAQTYVQTRDGSRTYAAYQFNDKMLAFSTGNIAYDAVSGHALQAERSYENLAVARVDPAAGTLAWQETSIPRTNAHPGMAVRDGRFWTTGEPARADSSTGVVLATSTDGAKWRQIAVPTTAKSATFSFAAPGPNGRLGIAYYGSDVAAPPERNGGNWSLYVIESDNPLAAQPTWTETRLQAVHEGDVCTPSSCAYDCPPDPCQLDDAYGRFSLEYIGAAMDDSGNLHVAYVDDLVDHVPQGRYVRQLAV